MYLCINVPYTERCAHPELPVCSPAYRTNSKDPIDCTKSCPYILHQNISTVKDWEVPQALPPTSKQCLGMGQPALVQAREKEAKWVKVKHPSLALMCLSLSERACLQFFYIIVSCSSSLSVIPNNSRLRTSEGPGGHDLAFSCPKAGILSIKRPSQASCSCPTSSSNHHGWC